MMVVGTADWSIAAGILVYLIAIVFATLYYYRYKKIFLVMFVTSIATYIFAVLYAWDIFELNKNWVMLMLLISTGLMIFLGKYFSKIELKLDKLHTSLKEKNSK